MCFFFLLLYAGIEKTTDTELVWAIPQWLLYLIPELARVTGLLAKALTWALPAAVLRSLVRLVMGFPPENAVETTLAFLGSRRGVRQALYVCNFTPFSIFFLKIGRAHV